MKPTSPAPARWEKLADATVATTPVLDLHRTRFRHPGRAVERDFVVIHPPDWVNVLALTPAHHLVLVRQFRFGIDGFSLEIPGGCLEVGEDPVTAGLRELSEETGFAGKSARLIGSVHPNPAIQSNRSHFVLVENAVPSSALAWDPDEEIEVTTLPVDDVLALARSGGITHGLVLDALFCFEPVWREMKEGGSPA
jgi:8-oxo-dGTP pyrophosphatase MutT (NUDIX family)